MRRRRGVTRSVLALAALAVAVGVWRAWPRSPYASSLAPGTPPYLTVLLVDGLSQDVFRDELRAGHLPEMQKLIDEGTYVEDGVTAFPSMTGFAFYPVLTGHDATESGVLGLRWFDRAAAQGNLRNYVGRTNVRMNDDFAARPLTLFERFPAQRSSSFNSYADRGAQRRCRGGWSFSMAKYRDQNRLVRAVASLPWIGSRLVPDWIGAEDRVLALALDDLRYRPKVQWITFASPDAYDHVHGMDATYRLLVRHVDTMIGRYRAESARLGQEPQRVYAVLSDHGVVDATRNVDLAADLAARYGLRLDRDHATNLRSDALTRPLDDYADDDGIVAVNGNTLNYLYFRDPAQARHEGFRAPLPWTLLTAYPRRGGAPVNLIDAVSACEGVELVAYRDAHGDAALRGASGVATIHASGDELAYTFTGDDPLGYASDPRVMPLLDGRPHSADAWLAATHAGLYPDAPLRVHRLLHADGCGDLVVTAKPGYDLARDFEMIVGNYRGGHGGLRADQMRVPYILAGPGIARGVREPTERVEDIGARLHVALGLPDPRRP